MSESEAKRAAAERARKIGVTSTPVGGRFPFQPCEDCGESTALKVCEKCQRERNEELEQWLDERAKPPIYGEKS